VKSLSSGGTTWDKLCFSYEASAGTYTGFLAACNISWWFKSFGMHCWAAGCVLFIHVRILSVGVYCPYVGSYCLCVCAYCLYMGVYCPYTRAYCPYVCVCVYIYCPYKSAHCLCIVFISWVKLWCRLHVLTLGVFFIMQLLCPALQAVVNNQSLSLPPNFFLTLLVPNFRQLESE